MGVYQCSDSLCSKCLLLRFGGGGGRYRCVAATLLNMIWVWSCTLFVMLCMQFGTLTGFLVCLLSFQNCIFYHGCSVALQLLFSMCWTWSRQRRRRGRRPHDVHVRCFEVHGTIHMMAAKSTTWSYLKRAWDNDLTFERASRSLAKTGFLGPPETVISCRVFDVFRRWGWI